VTRPRWRRPSFLLIVTDQERLDALGRHSSRICRTPKLDRLAKQGHRRRPTRLAPRGLREGLLRWMLATDDPLAPWARHILKAV
jgi:hypothetical protein